MRAYCKAAGETYDIDPEECTDCNEDCDVIKGQEQFRQARLLKLKKTDFANEMLKRLAAVFGVTEADVAPKVDNILKEMQKVSERVLTDLVTTAVESHVIRMMDERVTKLVDETFQKIVSDKILSIGTNQQTLVTTLQEHIANRIKESLATKDNNWGRRDITEETIDTIITHSVQAKVDEAIKELKEQTQDKYSKEAMKKMLEGMAKAIGQDKRLLSMICATE